MGNYNFSGTKCFLSLYLTYFCRFFLYIYICTFFLITGYFICSLYNLLWIMSPHVGRLSSFLHGCQREVDFYKPDRKMHKLDENRPTVRLNLYFKVNW